MCLYLVEVFSSSALGSARGRVVPWNECAFSLLVVLCVLREGAALPHREKSCAEFAPWLDASAHCFPDPKAGCSEEGRSPELTGSSELMVVKLQGEGGRGKVGARAKKYIQGSLCYASVQLQIVLCTERVTKDVEGWQGKFGVRLSLYCLNGENVLCFMTPCAARHMK